jgi:hypothetical protein
MGYCRLVLFASWLEETDEEDEEDDFMRCSTEAFPGCWNAFFSCALAGGSAGWILGAFVVATPAIFGKTDFAGGFGRYTGGGAVLCDWILGWRTGLGPGGNFNPERDATVCCRGTPC